METHQAILEGTTDREKIAYIGAIASIATADHNASEEELEYISALCESAGLSEAQTAEVLQSAKEASDVHLKQQLDVLKNSELRFSLVTDLITFAKADQDYSEAEQQHVQQVAQLLGVDQQQFGLLNQYSEQALSANAPAQEVASPNFLANTGLQQKMQSAGINTGGLLKGLLSFAGPMILASLLKRRGGAAAGGLGGALGGMLGGGLGGMMSGGKSGGLGSLIGMLSGGRGMKGAGGLLGRVLGGKF